jgi:tRNA threonylcarbamoyladenosine biosynthesis protein TsaE
MGTGKTLFARGVAEGLGLPQGRGVRSPTFTLVHEYMGRHPIYHLDLYRIRGEEELEGIGWEEMLYGKGVTVIEAAEKLEQKLPEDRLDVVLEREGLKRRRLVLVGYGRRFQSLVRTLAVERGR